MEQTISKNHGFSLMEAIIIIVIIGILMAIALPNYSKSIAKSQEREAVLQLMTIHTANNLYSAQNGNYLDGSLDITGINSKFNLNVVSDKLTYSYIGYVITKTFEIRATSQQFGFIVKATEGPLVKGVNPCCEFLTVECPSLPNCI